jgi:NAD(P)H-hydrate epimerase
MDADGLNACAGCDDLFTSRSEETILTPHVGEFARLSGYSREDILVSPIELSRTYAVENGVVLVLKGAPSVIASPDGWVMINPTGNAGMATAGSGDVLTGLIAGFWAQGMPAVWAASLAVYLHGLAGDRAKDRLGEWSLMAGDLLTEVPTALVELSHS